MLPQKIFKIRILKLAKNDFHAAKLPDISLTLRASRVDRYVHFSGPCLWSLSDVCSVPRRVFSTVGDIFSTVGISRVPSGADPAQNLTSFKGVPKKF